MYMRSFVKNVANVKCGDLVGGRGAGLGEGDVVRYRRKTDGREREREREREKEEEGESPPSIGCADLNFYRSASTSYLGIETFEFFSLARICLPIW
jgi:hypothetical protein